MSSKSILKRINALGTLSATEAKIAKYIEVSYPNSVMVTINEMAERCGVSVASISRFIQKLDYKTYADFKRIEQTEISDRLASPIERYTPNADKKSYRDHLSLCIENLHETMQRIEDADVEKSVDILVKAETLYITGGASATALAQYFSLFAKYLRRNVVHLTSDISTLAHNLSDLGKNDALLVISQYRSSKVATELAKLFHSKKCDVVLISDRQASPISPYASQSLIVCSKSNYMFNSRAATLAMLEALIDCMIPHCEAIMKDKFKIMEEVFKEFDVYAH